MIDRLNPWSALGLGLAVSIVSPTHLLAIASFGAAIAGSTMSVADQIAVAVIFIVLCTSSITVPVGVAIVEPARSEAPLRRLHEWLSEHGQTVLVVLFLVIGVIFVGRAIAAVG
jgi:threonine/homoserine/homoserine lactone efflux protein